MQRQSQLAPIFAVWGNSPKKMAEELSAFGVEPSPGKPLTALHVKMWRHRDSIPPQYWEKIILAAAGKGVALQWTQFVTEKAAKDAA